MGIAEKMAFLFPGEERKRVRVSESSSGNLYISLDVHGMRCWQAKRSVNNLINIVQSPFILTVIHGYRHGTAILDMVRYEFNSKRIKEWRADNYNRGVTHLSIT